MLTISTEIESKESLLFDLSDRNIATLFLFRRLHQIFHLPKLKLIHQKPRNNHNSHNPNHNPYNKPDIRSTAATTRYRFLVLLLLVWGRGGRVGVTSVVDARAGGKDGETGEGTADDARLDCSGLGLAGGLDTAANNCGALSDVV